MDEQLKQELTKLLKQGSKIGAIKVYKEATNADLVDAKKVVESLQFELIQERLKQGEDIKGTLIEMVKEGRRVEAIKLYCDTTGVSVSESKKHVETLMLTVPKSEIKSVYEDDEQMVLDHYFKSGRKGAIKWYQSKYGGIQNEASEYVDYVLTKSELNERRKKPTFLNSMLIVLVIILIFLIVKSLFF